MTAIVWNLLSFVVALAILIAVHEWGHFWVARRCGVFVQRFSLGFGKVLFSWRDRHGTDFSLSLIPLGGYVKMLDERVESVPEARRHQAFNTQSVWRRFAIVAAGPCANFVFALLVFWLMFLLGVPSVKPVIGTVQPGSLAAQSGLLDGMEIVAVDGQQTLDWEGVTYQLVRQIGKPDVTITVQAAGEQPEQKRLQLHGWTLNGKEEQAPFIGLGIEPVMPEVLLQVGQLVPKGSAEQAGLMVDDELVSLDGIELKTWQQFVTQVQLSPDVTLHLVYRRAGQLQQTDLTPTSRDAGDKVVGYVGLAPRVKPLDDRYRIELQYGPLEAVSMAVKKTVDVMGLTLDMVSKLFTGVVSLDNLSGPISIAKGAGSTASFGLVYFLGFLGLVSINLGIINLFPLPVLDGGHLMFFVAEAIRGKPVPERFQEYAFKFGAAVLVCLMGIALFNDFVRL